MDLQHRDVTASLTDISFVDDGVRANVTFENDEETFEDYKTWKFGLGQLLKFAELKKGDIIDNEGEVVADAPDVVLDALYEQDLVFKYNDEQEVIAVVSPEYVSLPSEEVETLAREAITGVGVADFQTVWRRKNDIVTEVEFVFTGDDGQREVAQVGDILRGGLHVRNSVFGASSLRVNKFYTILKCSNGMVLRNTEESFRQVHMGDPDVLREAFQEEVSNQITNIWEETDLITKIYSVEFPIEDQLKYLAELAEDRKITKTSARSMVGHILVESGYELPDDFELEGVAIPEALPEGDIDWNTGEENLWSFVNAFTGYTTHSELSSESTKKQLERVYNELIEMETTGDLKRLVAA